MDNHKDDTLVFGSSSVYVDKHQHFQLHLHAIKNTSIEEHEGVDSNIWDVSVEGHRCDIVYQEVELCLSTV